jgi:hypothetical protein
LQIFPSFSPNISKFIAWILQAFPNISFAVLSLFKDLRGPQGDYPSFANFCAAEPRRKWTRKYDFRGRLTAPELELIEKAP